MVRQSTNKMNPLLLDSVGNFFKKNLSPSLSVRGRSAVRNTVTTDDYNVCLRAFCHYSRKRTHKNMIAPQRLEIAGGESNDLI